MIVSTGLTVPVAVAVRVIVPRAAGAVTYCTALLPPSAHRQAANTATTRSKITAAASQNFLAPDHFAGAAVEDDGADFNTFPRASTCGASELVD